MPDAQGEHQRGRLARELGAAGVHQLCGHENPPETAHHVLLLARRTVQRTCTYSTVVCAESITLASGKGPLGWRQGDVGHGAVLLQRVLLAHGLQAVGGRLSVQLVDVARAREQVGRPVRRVPLELRSLPRAPTARSPLICMLSTHPGNASVCVF